MTGGPGIWFDVLDFDFGPMSNAETRKTVFTFTNTGDAPLELKDVVPACGCTRPTFAKKAYAPGESGTIEVAFTPPTGGHQAKSISVFTNAKVPGELVKIRVIGEVETVLSFEPRSFDLGEVSLGTSHDAQFELLADAETTTFENVVSRTPLIAVKFVEGSVAPGKATIALTLAAGAPWGYLRQGALMITTRGKLENGETVSKQFPFRLTGTVVDDIKASSYVIQCGSSTPGSPFRGEAIIFSASGKEFEIVETKIEPLDPNAKGVAATQFNAVEVTPSTDPEKKGFKLAVTGTAGQRSGFISGTVFVKTREKGSPEIVERAFGLNGRVDEPGATPPQAPPRR